MTGLIQENSSEGDLIRINDDMVSDAEKVAMDNSKISYLSLW